MHQPDLFRLMGSIDKDTDVLSFLTTKEKLVLELCARGMTSNEIATTLHISHRTVESHRASFMRKLKLRNQTDVVRFAVRKRLVEA